MAESEEELKINSTKMKKESKKAGLKLKKKKTKIMASLVAQLITNLPAKNFLGLIPGLGRSPGEGKGYPLQCFGLENSMDHIVHGVLKSRTQLSDFYFHF